MKERKPEGNPLLAMAAGGFLGGLVVGGNNAGLFWFFALSLGCAYALLVLLGHVAKGTKDHWIGPVLGLSTFVPLPCGFLGIILGKSIWGSP